MCLPAFTGHFRFPPASAAGDGAIVPPPHSIYVQRALSFILSIFETWRWSKIVPQILAHASFLPKNALGSVVILYHLLPAPILHTQHHRPYRTSPGSSRRVGQVEIDMKEGEDLKEEQKQEGVEAEGEEEDDGGEEKDVDEETMQYAQISPLLFASQRERARRRQQAQTAQQQEMMKKVLLTRRTLPHFHTMHTPAHAHTLHPLSQTFFFRTTTKALNQMITCPRWTPMRTSCPLFCPRTCVQATALSIGETNFSLSLSLNLHVFFSLHFKISICFHCTSFFSFLYYLLRSWVVKLCLRLCDCGNAALATKAVVHPLTHLLSSEINNVSGYAIFFHISSLLFLFSLSPPSLLFLSLN